MLPVAMTSVALALVSLKDSGKNITVYINLSETSRVNTQIFNNLIMLRCNAIMFISLEVLPDEDCLLIFCIYTEFNIVLGIGCGDALCDDVGSVLLFLTV